MIESGCLFRNVSNSEVHKIIDENDLAFARWDNFPASNGHAGIVPKRHVESVSDLEPDEFLAIYGLAQVVREVVVAQFNPDGFTIGINEGEAAGGSIRHLCMHLIPRYTGDVENPRGGVRGVIPDKQNY